MGICNVHAHIGEREAWISLGNTICTCQIYTCIWETWISLGNTNTTVDRILLELRHRVIMGVNVCRPCAHHSWRGLIINMLVSRAFRGLHIKILYVHSNRVTFLYTRLVGQANKCNNATFLLIMHLMLFVEQNRYGQGNICSFGALGWTAHIIHFSSIHPFIPPLYFYLSFSFPCIFYTCSRFFSPLLY